MSTSHELRERFTDGGLATASGPKIIDICFGRLDRDLGGALEALELHQVERTHELLCHAQDIVHELLCMLDVDAWEHARSLASIYRYVLELLTGANVQKSRDPVDEARWLMSEIGDAFRQAALAPSASSTTDDSGRSFSVRA